MPAATGMKVNHVIAETPADKTNSKLNEGDIITAINGQTFSEEENFYNLLNGLVNEKILLSVANAEGKKREVVIRPAASLVNNLYEEWVENRKKMVEKFSNGRLEIGRAHV